MDEIRTIKPYQKAFTWGGIWLVISAGALSVTFQNFSAEGFGRMFARLLALSLGFFAMTEITFAQSTSGAVSAPAVEEVLNQSLAQKKGMSIYIGGQVINAIFVKRIDANMIEVKNQTFGRIIIRMDRVDAIAIS